SDALESESTLCSRLPESCRPDLIIHPKCNGIGWLHGVIHELNESLSVGRINTGMAVHQGWVVKTDEIVPATQQQMSVHGHLVGRLETFFRHCNLPRA